MKSSIFSTIERIIGTPYAEDPLGEGSVCFESGDEVRAEFLPQFTAYDVVNYAYGILYQLHYAENEGIGSVSVLKIPYPSNADFFWQCCAIGKKMRFEHPIGEMELISLSELNWENA
ncbi:hypothetical protein ABXT06_22275 [Flavobacterium sp. UW10123]|uniref:hypothetical protein n=1 Tax=Flavobacterium sp. UW10123 TaxID=3230800 RepID=UPI003391508A